MIFGFSAQMQHCYNGGNASKIKGLFMRRLCYTICMLCLIVSWSLPNLPAFAQTTVDIPAGDVEALRTAINAAVQAGKPVVLNLAKGATYIFTKPDASQAFIGGKLQDRKQFTSGSDALPLITTAITISGNGSTFKRQGDAHFRFFSVFVSGSLTLQDLTLESGSPTDDGGAIEDMTTGLTVGLTATRVTFKNNRTTNQGGALYSAGSILLTDCQFIDNQAAREGGAAYVSSGSLTVRGGLFQNNQTTTGTTYGGAINGDEGTRLDIQGAQFTGNSAASGGAMAINGTATVKGARFTANQSFNRGQNDVGGGAIYVGNYAELTLTDSTLADNQAEKGGGALAVNEGRNITVSGNVFSNNIAALASGAGAIVFLTTNATETVTKAAVNQNCFLNDSMKMDKKNVPEEVFISASFGGVVTLDATNNWWGSANGPTPEQRGQSKDRSQNLSAPFTYQPFLTVAPAICSGATPTPGKAAVVPTATVEPDCSQYSGGDYKVTVPKGALPTGAKLICAPGDDSLTLFALDKNNQPIQAFNPPLKVCLKGKGSLLFLSLTSGIGKLTSVTATVEGAFVCAQVKTPGMLQLKN